MVRNQLRWLCVLAFSRVSFFAPIPDKIYYGFIFDVGSTDTRLNAFSINIETQPAPISAASNEYPVKFLDRKKCGIAFNASTVMKSAHSKIDECLQAMIDKLGIDTKTQQIWIKFVATGGMRMLRSTHKDKYENILNSMERYFLSKSYTMPSNEEHVEVIDERTEAELAFISSIYVENTKKVEEKGVIDVGGSSLQIVFPISDSAVPAPPYMTKGTVNLFNQDHKYGLYNFNCGGTDNIKNYYLISLFKEQAEYLHKQHSINSPCHPSGFRKSFKTEFFTNNCTKNILVDMKLPESIPIVGTSDNAECKSKLQEAFCAHSDATYNSRCLLNVDSAEIRNPNPINVNLLGAWYHFSKDFDERNYAELLKKMNQMFDAKNCIVEDKGIERCFSVKYLSFITGFFITSKDTLELHKTSSGWAIGKMLVESRNVNRYRKNRILLIITLVVLVLFSILSLAGFWYCHSKVLKKNSRKKHDMMV